MIPGLLASEVATALREFIVTGFESETVPFAGEFRRLVEESDNGEGFLKGPYVSIGLPFLTGKSDRNFFSSFQTDFPPYAHQEDAWKRITSNTKSENTIVATGTGSGKTECFMYPLLDHCQRNSGKGVKAIVIYPMNALATDQAKRFAETIHSQPGLKDLRVGLYVGGETTGGQRTMTESSVITCRDTMQQDPPDILLTNYKMLDYLLIRAQDQLIWQHNTPESLKYLVVDELHTFDGAQGTDLALLLRRLKSRLETPKDHIAHIGTSATLGGGDQIQGLLDYAGDVFSSNFRLTSIIQEQRVSVIDFMDTLDYLQLNKSIEPSDLSSALEHGLDAYLEKSYELIFNEPYDGDSIESKSGKIELGKKLRTHGQTQNLLNALNGKTLSLNDLAQALRSRLPASFKSDGQLVILAMVSLLAHARGEDGRALVTTRIQLWVRELRRILSKVSDAEKFEDRSEPLLSFADDALVSDNDAIRLPLAQCRECHGTAWLSRVEPGHSNGQPIETKLENIYGAFFSENPELAVLLPVQKGLSQTGMMALAQRRKLCMQCGGYHGDNHKGPCANCNATESMLVNVDRVPMLKEYKKDGVNKVKHEKNCPYCSASNSLIIFGSRAASLSSVAIHRIFSSRDNDDRKLIAFSDSVQDATHRAGFFSARTWQENIRTAITQLIENEAAVTLTNFGESFERYWFDGDNYQGKLSLKQYVREFMPPDLRYTSDFEVFEKTGEVLAEHSLREAIKIRVTWVMLQDLSWRQKVGRSLNRVGVASLTWDINELALDASAWLQPLKDSFGVTADIEKANTFLQGLVWHMCNIGAISWSPLSGYIEKGKTYQLQFIKGLPNLGPGSPKPKFPAMATGEVYEQINTANSWYIKWWHCVFAEEQQLLDQKQLMNAIESSFDFLTKNGWLNEYVTQREDAIWAVNIDRVAISTSLLSLNSPAKRPYIVALNHAEYWENNPVIDAISPDDCYSGSSPVKDSLFANLYRDGVIHRVIAHEHTGLLARAEREAVENSFIKGTKPWEYNLLSATPTLEMGIDIGDLSSVLLCSVPPSQANYLQRIGRGGRRDGNSFVLTVANGRPHDLVFFSDPSRMYDEPIDSPAIFLQAKHVLRRQLLAFTFDNWVKELGEGALITSPMSKVLDAVEKENETAFPYTLFNYISKNRQAIWDVFSSEIATKLNDTQMDSLQRYFFGDGTEDDIRTYVLTKLKLVSDERKRLNDYIKDLDKQIKNIEKRPQDEERDKIILELKQEIEGHKKLKYNINKRESLNYLTDEGLLPNYAFPEEGTLLKSVIFRSEKNIDPNATEKQNFIKSEYEYQRPAKAALTELAPTSIFYAGNRKVQITRVDTARGKNIEEWRFCPDCSYSAIKYENVLVTGFDAPVCPRCQSKMWSDSQCKTKLLKMTQVYAFSNAKDTVLDDASDNREPLMFNKQLLVDFEQKDLGEAWTLEDSSKPFGFEFIKNTRFTEVNFGLRDAEGESFSIAGTELNRAGFKICKDCGTVQKSKQPEHLKSCRFDGSNIPGDGVENCLYLYRQFNSEAIRILLPRLSTGGTEQQVNSFVASLQLGLKLHFGGKVDHLQIAYQSEPVGDQGARKHFIVLYDSVPGGTGYLPSLITDQLVLKEVFKAAYSKMSDCSCYDGTMDGCYRCIMEYKNSFGMTETSKEIALAMLKDIIGDDITWVKSEKSLSSLNTLPWIDSELEARFPAALSKYSGESVVDGKKISVRTDVVAGKTGYQINIGEMNWIAELQAEVGPSVGVQVNSKPDLILRSGSNTKPIAIFLDGYEYHKDIVQQDCLKRQALINAGYLVWSLNWHDINLILGETNTRLALITKIFTDKFGMATKTESMLNAAGLGWSNWIRLNSMDRLMIYLANPAKEVYGSLALISLMAMFSNKAMQDKSNRDAAQLRIDSFPLSLKESAPVTPSILSRGAWTGDYAEISTQISIDKTVLKGDLENGIYALGIDLAEGKVDKALQEWQLFWTFSNIIQFLPNSYIYTSTAKNDAQTQALIWGGEPTLYSTDEDIPEWMREVDEDVRVEMEAMSAEWPSDIEVGYELTNEQGEVIAEAEMSLPRIKLVFVFEEDEISRNIFLAADWHVVHTVEALYKELGIGE